MQRSAARGQDPSLVHTQICRAAGSNLYLQQVFGWSQPLVSDANAFTAFLCHGAFAVPCAKIRCSPALSLSPLNCPFPGPGNSMISSHEHQGQGQHHSHKIKGFGGADHSNQSPSPASCCQPGRKESRGNEGCLAPPLAGLGGLGLLHSSPPKMALQHGSCQSGLLHRDCPLASRDQRAGDGGALSSQTQHLCSSTGGTPGVCQLKEHFST